MQKKKFIDFINNNFFYIALAILYVVIIVINLN